MAPQQRSIPQGTFVVMAIVAVGLVGMAAFAVYGLVQIATARPDTSPPGVGALSIIALKLIEMVLGWGDRVFRWTRGESDEPDPGPPGQ